jgi:hypothetical protein
MTNVVAIELCEDFFKDEDRAQKWIAKSQYADVLRVVGFNLRRNGQAKLLTNEKKRPVFQWNSGLGMYTGINIERPMSTVVVATAAGTKWTAVDLPHPLEATIQREKQKAANHKARVEAQRLKREEEAKNKPPKVKKTRKDGKPHATRKRKTPASYLNEVTDPYGVNVGEGPHPTGLETLAGAASTFA